MDELPWLVAKDEIEFSKIQFKGKAGGRLYKYKEHLDGLAVSRVTIGLMSIFVFNPVLLNYLFHNVFHIELLLETGVLSFGLIVAVLIFNEYRMISFIVSIPITAWFLFICFSISGKLNFYRTVFGFAMFFLIIPGVYHHLEAKKIRKELELHLRNENRVI